MKSQSKTWSIILIAVMLLAGLLSGCAAPQPAATAAPVHLKVGLQPFMGYAPIFIAQEEGFFARQGLDVEFVPFNASGDAVPMLMQGQLDLTPLALNPALFNAIAKGGEGRLIFGLSQWSKDGCPSSGIVALTQNAELFANPASWKGRTFASDPAGLTGMVGFFISQALSSGGLKLEDIKYVKLPPAATGDALQSGAIDLVQATEPWITNLVASGSAKLLVRAQDILPEGQLSVINFSSRLLKDPELGKRAARAYLAGVRQYLAGKTDRNVEILAKYTKMEAGLVRQICWPAVTADGSMNLESIQAYQAWAVSQGLLDAPVLPAVYLDQRFQGLAPGE